MDRSFHKSRKHCQTVQVLIAIVSLLFVLYVSSTVFAQTEKKIKNILKSEISLLESLQEIDFTILKYEEILDKTQKRIDKIQTKREEVQQQYSVSYEKVGRNKQMVLKRLRSLRLLRKLLVVHSVPTRPLPRLKPSQAEPRSR